MSNDTISNSKSESLDEEVIDLKGKISELDGKEETYNQYYLNAKENPKSYGLFGSLGLRTVQDWVLAYFFFSYVLFAFLLLVMAVKMSQTKWTAAIVVLSVSSLIGIILTVLLKYYA